MDVEVSELTNVVVVPAPAVEFAAVISTVGGVVMNGVPNVIVQDVTAAVPTVTWNAWSFPLREQKTVKPIGNALFLSLPRFQQG
jgi:hypothetical protein